MNIPWSTALVVAAAVIGFSILAWFSGRAKRRAATTHAQFTAKDVESALVAVLSPGYHGTFDEFLAWPINDPYLESIRQECLSIDQEFPPTVVTTSAKKARSASLHC